MNALSNPKWLYIVNTLPILIIFFLYRKVYNVINSLLQPEQIEHWQTFAFGLGALGILHLCYTVFAHINNHRLGVLYGLTTIIVYTVYLYAFMYCVDDIIPWSIPRWMFSDNSMIYMGTFLMPTLGHALFVIVTSILQKEEEPKALYSFAGAVAVPVFVYVFFRLITPLWKIIGYRAEEHFYMTFVIVATVVFLYFLLRVLVILVTRKDSILDEKNYGLRIILGIVFPILGLSINNGVFSPMGSGGSFIFGDFSHLSFLVIAILNGILFCVPTQKNKKLNLVLFFLQSVTLTYIFYFFIVFLPYLPFSIIAIIFIGVGFLMLTPLVLFLIQAYEHRIRYFNLLEDFGRGKVSLVLVAGILTLPAILQFNYYHDRATLHNALGQLYHPDLQNQKSIDLASLKSTLSRVIRSKGNNRFGGSSGAQVPYLSSYYNWFVMDNLTLSASKINDINLVYFDEIPYMVNAAERQDTGLAIVDYKVESVYDESSKTWTSWLNFDIQNSSTNFGQSEYSTSFELPAGCYISDYYLYVGDEKKHGILAEKRAAKWVYSQVVNTRKDPGILYYDSGNTIDFKVFPFRKGEIRKTGIEFTHKEPVALDIDDISYQLGDEDAMSTQEVIIENSVAYVSKERKKLLSKTMRTPYYHFVMDGSEGSDSLRKEYINRVNSFLAQSKGKEMGIPRFSILNYKLEDLSSQNWESEYEMYEGRAGVNLKLGIERILAESYNTTSDEYPVIIVACPSMNGVMIADDFKDYKFTYPENSNFYYLNDDDTIYEHSLLENSKRGVKISTMPSFDKEVYIFPYPEKIASYLSTDDVPEIALRKRTDVLEFNDKLSIWEQGVAADIANRNLILNPHLKETKWLGMVKSSFQSQVMNPFTSFIVLETKAQEAAMLQKQADLLNGSVALDAGDTDMRRMSEPSIWIVTLFLLFIFWHRNRSLLLS